MPAEPTLGEQWFYVDRSYSRQREEIRAAPGDIRVELIRPPIKTTWFQHLIPLTRSVSWPVAVVVVALVFHDDISKQLNRVENVKLGKVELALQAVREAVSTGNTFETPQQAPASVKIATRALVNLQQALPTGDQAASAQGGWSFVGEYSRATKTWARQTLHFNSNATPDTLRGNVLTVIDAVYVRRTAPTTPEYSLDTIVGVLPEGARVAIVRFAKSRIKGG